MDARNFQIKFGIKRLEVRTFSFNEIAINLLYEKVAPVINFTVVPDIKLSEENKIVGVFLDITAFVQKEGNTENIGNIKTLSEFNVENLDELIIRKDNGLVEFPPLITKTLISVAYSNSRGLLITRGGGTILGIVPMPIVDPSVFVKERD